MNEPWVSVIAGVGTVAIVVLPLLQLYAKAKQDRYRKHGEQTGEW